MSTSKIIWNFIFGVIFEAFHNVFMSFSTAAPLRRYLRPTLSAIIIIRAIFVSIHALCSTIVGVKKRDFQSNLYSSFPLRCPFPTGGSYWLSSCIRILQKNEFNFKNFECSYGYSIRNLVLNFLKEK